jgi:DNA invertase Pin-like site-specific DNA recombinase
MRAVIYSRFSTDRQNESSIADQERICTEYAERQGWEIAERYEDKGISGAAIGNRPGLLRMQEAALARKIDVLLVMDISRLSRSMGDVAKLADRFTFCGVRIIAVHDGADTAREGWEMQFGLAGLIGQHFRKMVARKTHAALETRAKLRQATGGRAFGFRNGGIDEREAAVVKEIFEEFAHGATARAIAIDLNRRGIPAPRSREGWHSTGVRVILRNPRYVGRVIWNQRRWVKDPDSGAYRCSARPPSEWVEYHDEAQRLVSDQLWDQVRRRDRLLRGDDRPRLSRGRPRYLLSGLMFCAECGRPYTMASNNGYSCAGFHETKRCTNHVYVNREKVEQAILGPVREELLSPARVARMATAMREEYRARMRARAARAQEAPRELTDLTARIARLRERLRQGDPDLTADEIQAAIERAEAKKRALETKLPQSRAEQRVADFLPRAAALYKAQVAKGLEGDAREAAKARIVLRQMFGRINMRREGEKLFAEYTLKPEALLQVVGLKAVGNDYMEVRICHSSGKNLSSSAFAR